MGEKILLPSALPLARCFMHGRTAHNPFFAAILMFDNVPGQAPFCAPITVKLTVDWVGFLRDPEYGLRKLVLRQVAISTHWTTVVLTFPFFDGGPTNPTDEMSIVTCVEL